MSITSFNELPISPEVLRAIGDMGFEEATPIQAEAIPHILEGRDILGQAQTGTGKTCAFGIPIIDRVDLDDNHIQYLILSPTRELAMQIADELHEVTKYKEGVRILSVYGGQSIDRQIMALKKKPQIIVGTPGRVMDHMRRKTMRIENLRGIILDEADEMLNMGFKEDIDTILASTPEKIQKIFFSATMPRLIAELTQKYLVDPVHVRIIPKQMTVANVEQFYIEVKESNKIEVLCRLIEAEHVKLALIFCNMKRRVDDITEKLQTRGYSAEALHGDMKQMARTRVMNRFKHGECELLVATDVAARGIDVEDIEVVINYDLPQDEEYYVHRIGRTARAGKGGKSYTFVVGREIIDLKNIQHYTKSNIMSAQPPTLMDVTESRVGSILNGIQEQLEQGELETYVNYVEKFVDGLNVTSPSDVYYTTAEVAAAMLRQAMGQSFAAATELEPVIPYQELMARRNAARRAPGGGGGGSGSGDRGPGASSGSGSGAGGSGLGYPSSGGRMSATEGRGSGLVSGGRPAHNVAAGQNPNNLQDSLMNPDADYTDEADDDAYFGGGDARGDARDARPKAKRTKVIEEGMARLFLNVGSDDKILPKHVVQAICSHSDLSGHQIGAIAIYGRYTFVDVPECNADQVVQNLAHQKVGGRVVNVEKSGGTGGPGGGGGDARGPGGSGGYGGGSSGSVAGSGFGGPRKSDGFKGKPKSFKSFDSDSKDRKGNKDAGDRKQYKSSYADRKDSKSGSFEHKDTATMKPFSERKEYKASTSDGRFSKAKDSKDSKDSKVSKDSKDSRDSKDSKDSKDFKGSSEGKPLKAKEFKKNFEGNFAKAKDFTGFKGLNKRK